MRLTRKFGLIKENLNEKKLRTLYGGELPPEFARSPDLSEDLPVLEEDEPDFFRHTPTRKKGMLFQLKPLTQ